MKARTLLLLAFAFVLSACNVSTPTPRGGAPEFDRVTEVTPTVPLPSNPGTGAMQDETPNIWFVELAGTPTIDGGSLSVLSSNADTFLDDAAQAGIPLTLRYRFETFLSGVSVEVESDYLARLSTLPGVVSLSPVPEVTLPEPGGRDSVESQLFFALDMTGASVAQEELGLSGEGIRVGIVDSGIALTHPEFRGRIVAGFDFVGDAYNASDPENNTPIPEPGPGTRPGGGDCGGHGTHVAGIVAAGGEVVTGVAPKAQLGAYRIFGCEGSSSFDVIVQALELAYEDGMDIVNLSLGSPFGWPQSFQSRALSRFLELGMIPVASAGNNGAEGVYSAGSPGVGANVITVASFDNTQQRLNFFNLPDGTQVPYGIISTTPPPPTEGTSPEIVFVGQGCLIDDYLTDPDGLVALITRGACTFDEKYARAVEAGAVGVIIENNVPGNFAGGGVVALEDTFAISISQESGAQIKALSAPVAEWSDELISITNPTGDLISSFSSYGLAPDLTLKPNLGAPGGLITSTYFANEQNTYTVLSGTSMSSPHVAGAVALLLEANQRDNLGITPSQVRSRMQNSSVPKPWVGNPGLGFLDSVHRQGAGMINIPSTVLAETVVVPGQLELGESASTVREQTLLLENLSDNEVTYTLTNEAGTIATSGPNPNTPGFFVSGAAVQFTIGLTGGPTTEVTVPAGGARNVNVTITPNPGLPDTSVYGGYLVFTPQGGNATTVRVPYTGFKGDYQALPSFNFTPFLAEITDDNAVISLPAGTVYTMRDGDVPTFAVGLLNYAERLQARLVPVGPTGPVSSAPVLDLTFLGRNTANGVYIYGFGAFDASFLPDGQYLIEVSVLKPLGDPTNPAHTETATTPVFTIDRTAE